MSIRVLIVDDHAVVRSGLRRCSTPRTDIEPVGEAGERRATPSSRRIEHKPDVILLDVVMPGQSGIEVHARAAAGASRDAKVLVLSMQDDPQLRARGVRRRRERLRAQGGRRHRGRRGGARGRGRRPLRPPEPRRAARRGRGGGAAPRRGRPALGPRARGAAPARARPHEPGDRQDALHLGAHGRDAPGAHHAEAPALEPRRARPLRARGGPARGPGRRSRRDGRYCTTRTSQERARRSTSATDASRARVAGSRSACRPTTTRSASSASAAPTSSSAGSPTGSR